MGIRGLQSYVEKNCPRACCQLSIADLVNDFRLHHPTCPHPVLAVDGMGCLQKMYGDLMWVMGGQWCEVMERWSTFVSKLHRLGIKLVFFFDGTTVTSKRERWVARRLRTVKDNRMIMDILKETGTEAPLSMFQLPVGMGLMTRYALKYALGCDVRTTLRECDEVVAEYARNCPDCFALLGQDSDYMVYYSTAPYLSVAHLDFDTLTTVLYDRQCIAAHFDLPMSQLPLLACLRGNDIVPESELLPFHQWLCKGRRDDLRNSFRMIEKIADFVRAQNFRIEDCKGESAVRQLSELARKVFWDVRKVQLLMDALETYGMGRRREVDPEVPSVVASGHHPEVLRIAREKHENCENVPIIYTIMCGGTYESSTPMEDDRGSTFPPTALLYRPVRQRTYSLLVGPIGRNFVDEWCVYPGNKLERADRVHVLPIHLASGGSTSLDTLWLRASGRFKYETFLACFETSFGVDDLLRIPAQYHSPCCIVNYLIQNTNIAEWEVDALLVHMFHPIGQNLNCLKALKVTNLVVRCVELATLFLRGITTVLQALAVTAFPFRQELAMPWLFFDGKLLAHCYVKMKEGVSIRDLCGNEPACFQHFSLIQHVSKLGTRYQR